MTYLIALQISNPDIQLFSDTSRYSNDISEASAPLSLGNLRSVTGDRNKHVRDVGEKRGGRDMKSGSQFKHVRRVNTSGDSGNSSLNTNTTDSRKSAKSCENLIRPRGYDDWVVSSDI